MTIRPVVGKRRPGAADIIDFESALSSDFAGKGLSERELLVMRTTALACWRNVNGGSYCPVQQTLRSLKHQHPLAAEWPWRGFIRQGSHKPP